MVSWLSKKRQKKIVSYRYGLVAFPEAEKEKYWLGLWCRGFSRKREREILVRVMESWLSQRPKKRTVSLSYGVVVFQKASKKN